MALKGAVSGFHSVSPGKSLEKIFGFGAAMTGGQYCRLTVGTAAVCQARERKRPVSSITGVCRTRTSFCMCSPAPAKAERPFFQAGRRCSCSASSPKCFPEHIYIADRARPARPSADALRCAPAAAHKNPRGQGDKPGILLSGSSRRSKYSG